MNTPEKQADQIAALLRELYKANEGPRLIEEMMREFPNPRKVWNESDNGRPARWGIRAVDYAR